MVNENSLLDDTTVRQIHVVSQQLENPYDRSILIAGSYVVTTDSIVPVSETSD